MEGCFNNNNWYQNTLSFCGVINYNGGRNGVSDNTTAGEGIGSPRRVAPSGPFSLSSRQTSKFYLTTSNIMRDVL